MAQIVTQAADERLHEAEVTVDGRQYAYRVSVPDDLVERVGADRAAIVRATRPRACGTNREIRPDELCNTGEVLAAGGRHPCRAPRDGRNR